jgi:hypothetical protein
MCVHADKAEVDGCVCPLRLLFMSAPPFCKWFAESKMILNQLIFDVIKERSFGLCKHHLLRSNLDQQPTTPETVI